MATWRHGESHASSFGYSITHSHNSEKTCNSELILDSLIFPWWFEYSWNTGRFAVRVCPSRLWKGQPIFSHSFLTCDQVTAMPHSVWCMLLSEPCKSLTLLHSSFSLTKCVKHTGSQEEFEGREKKKEKKKKTNPKTLQQKKKKNKHPPH